MPLEVFVFDAGGGGGGKIVRVDVRARRSVNILCFLYRKWTFVFLERYRLRTSQANDERKKKARIKIAGIFL